MQSDSATTVFPLIAASSFISYSICVMNLCETIALFLTISVFFHTHCIHYIKISVKKKDPNASPKNTKKEAH